MIYRNDSHAFYGAGSRYYHSSAFSNFLPIRPSKNEAALPML